MASKSKKWKKKGKKMKPQLKDLFQFVLLVVSVCSLMFSNTAFAHDLNPAPYRGDPLSVYSHWELVPGTNILNLTNWNSVDDIDPATYLYPNFTPTPQIQPNGDIYQLQLPNWVDDMPVKYMRLQLAWENTLQPPVNVFSEGLDGVNLISGMVTFVSPLLQIGPGTSYQYYDFEFYPNPDFERIHVQVAPGGLLSQVVVDTVSTVPEPATIAILTLGGLGVRSWRRRV
jgi:hypothetical protein